MESRGVGRPRKYYTNQQRLIAQRAQRAPQVRSRYFRLVIPDLRQYTDPQALLSLKGDTLRLILDRQGQRLQYYKIAAQIHPVTKIPHLDILLLYRRSVRKSLNRFDYLVKHGELTRFRKLREAVLDYGDKDDKSSLHNMPEDFDRILQARQAQLDLYAVLQRQMVKDPFNFNSHSWLQANGLAGALSRTNWSKAIDLIEHQQQARCNMLLRDMPGFRHIDRDLIESRLTPQQLKTFDSWSGYQTIVDYLNMVPRYGSKRPRGTPNLLIVSRHSGIGKTSLFSDDNQAHFGTPVDRLCPTYFMGVRRSFPRYSSRTYRLILWDKMRLAAYSFDTILKLFEGFPTDLPYRGGATRKDDNPLIIMTSNLPLRRHINIKFMDQQDRQRALMNLSRRVTQLVVPEHLDLFLLQRLIVSA